MYVHELFSYIIILLRSREMKRLVFVMLLVLIVLAPSVMATSIDVFPSNQGTANYWGTGDVVYNETSWTDGPWSWIGCNNSIVTGYQSVLKFSLADFTANASSAMLSVFRYDCAPHADGVLYFQLQHITQATSGPIVRADVTVLTGENVGTPIDAYSSGQPMTWDVASYVNADIANGFACSSFRFIAVDAQGNWLQLGDTWAGICTDALVPGSVLSPQINAVIPEPATMALLLVGGLLIRRKK